MNKPLRKKMLLVHMGLILAAPAGAQTLSEAVKQTLETNPDVLIATTDRRAVDKELTQAKAGYLPSVDISAGIGWENSDNPTTQARGEGAIDMSRREGAITLRQMLFDGMATTSEVERQRARVQSRAFSAHGTAEIVGLRAVDAYLNVLKRQELVQIAQDNLKAHERTFDQIRQRAESGIGRRSDMDQSQGRLSLARSNLRAEENNLRDAVVNFQRVVGVEPMGLTRPELPAGALPASMDEAVQQAVADHPTLKSAGADVDAAQAQHEAAKSPYMPRVDLEIGASDNRDLDGIRGENGDISAMLRIRYNLFAGGRDRARIEQTAYLINEAKEVRNRTHREVVQSMQLSWNAYITAQEQLDYLKQHVDSSVLARDAYTKQFNIGQRTLLDLLDSENEVFVARTAYVNGQYTELLAAYRILAALGKLNETLNVPLPSEATAGPSERTVTRPTTGG